MKKGIFPYLTKAFNSMAFAFFSTLIIGIILEEVGRLTNIHEFKYYGSMVKYLMGPAIGVAVAYTRGAKGLALITSVVAGAIGANTINIVNNVPTMMIGDPISAFVVSLISVEFALLIEHKTNFDLFLIPLTVLSVSILAVIFISPIFVQVTKWVSETIIQATQFQPFLMGVVVSVLMGMALTAPISSAAIAISLGLYGLTAGAAAIGCAAQMIGFAVMTKGDNTWSDVIAVGIGSSMLQFGNIIKKPIIWLPPILTSAILGPISTVVFKLETNAYGAGMGTSGLVGPLTTLTTMGADYGIIIGLMFFIFPALITLIIYKGFVQMKWIKKGDLKIQKIA